MGKRLTQQARGKGGPAHRARSFAYAGDAKLRPISKELMTGTIIDIIRSAGHLAPLVKVKYEDGVTALTQAPEFVKVGEKVQAGPGSETVPGNTASLADIPEGTPIFNIESQPGDGGKFCRTSGTAARIVSKTEKYAMVMLPSKKEKMFNLKCRACIGVTAGGGRKEKPLLKAGTAHHAKRSKNKRYPIVSASAQNAVDHPFGNKRTSRKAKQKPIDKDAPPGRKVGALWPKRTGKKK